LVQGSVCFSCISLVSAVGYSPASAAAALRAGITGFQTLGYPDANGEPIVGAPVEALPPGVRGRERLAALVRLVFEELAPEIGARLPWDRLPVLLCTREVARPGGRLDGIVAGIELPGGVAITGRRARQIASGPTAAFEALGHARTILSETNAPGCLILAVDSLTDARTLQWLDAAERLKTSVQTDGVIPGEAACLAVVSKHPLTKTHLSVRGIGRAVETATVLDDTPFRADGMAAALRNALTEAELQMHQVDFRLSDVAGESYAFEELVLAQTRVMRQVRPSQPLWHPAECVGDCGAAAGLIQLAWAEQAFARGYAPGPIAALHASSAFGPRAAAIVQNPNPGGRA
jgi:3-oxoacyl-[acyl-carrier-protein] synthase I